MRLALIALLALSSAAATGPTAWSKSSWSMSAPDLRDAFAGQIADVPAAAERLRIGTSDRFETPALAIPQVDVAGTPFTVFFMVDPATGLQQVNLRPADPQLQATDTTYQATEFALTEKYGRPFSRSTAGDMHAEWKTPTALIRLTYHEVKAIRLRSLWLIYTPLPKNDTI